MIRRLSRKRRNAILAPRLTVRPLIPWYLRWLAILLLGASTGAAGWWAYEAGLLGGGGQEREALEAQLGDLGRRLRDLEKQNQALKSEIAVGGRQVQIERAANADLAKQVKALANENALLKEDLAFFHTVTNPGKKTDVIGLSRVLIEPNAIPGEFRYRMLLLQSRGHDTAFKGRFQLVVNTLLDRRKVVLTFPPPAEIGTPAYQLDFRVYQRVEGTFRVAPNAAVRSVQVRVYEKGQSQPKLMQTVNIS